MADAESPTANGLTQIFSKTKSISKKSRGSGSNSTASTAAESDGHRSMRQSLEGVVEKLKVHHDREESGGNGNGLKKLVPQSIGAKRRQKKQEKEEEQRLEEEAARGRSIADRGTLENDSPMPISRQDSSVSRDGDTGSSLLTYDSDLDS